jgi:hypothetical protein
MIEPGVGHDDGGERVRDTEWRVQSGAIAPMPGVSSVGNITPTWSRAADAGGEASFRTAISSTAA